MALAVTQSAVHRRQMVAGQRRRSLMARCRAMAGGATLVSEWEVAANTVALLGRAVATTMAAWPCHLMALFAGVLLVAGCASAAVDRCA